jgi:hypothetical protein
LVISHRFRWEVSQPANFTRIGWLPILRFFRNLRQTAALANGELTGEEGYPRDRGYIFDGDGSGW